MESHSPATEPENEESEKLIIKACDLCRKKKIRCQVIEESCVQCIKSKTQCIFTPVKSNKGPRRPPGYKHVEALEQRLIRMEALLQSTIQVPDDDVGRRQQSGTGSSSKKRKASPPPSLPRSSVVHHASKETSRHTRRLSNRPVPASSLAIERIPDTSQDENASLGRDSRVLVPNWTLTATSDIFAPRVLKTLPPKDEARLLIHETFENFNAVFPIFDQPSFLRDFEARYSEDKRDDPGWWACLNIVFAIAHRFRAMKKLDSQSEDCHAWGYLQNALTVVLELTMLKAEISSVQAILGMAILIQGTPYPQPSSVLISMALQLAQSMKLHRRDQGSGLEFSELEKRKRVFWIAYVFDKDISLRTGDPPAQDDDDMDADLPAETIDLNFRGVGGVSLFNLRIGLAIIQGQIYKKLSSTKALRLSETERSLAAKELEAMLDAWNQNVPIEFGSAGFGGALIPSNLPTLIHTVILEFTYFCALKTIQSSRPAASQIQIQTAEPSGQPLSATVSPPSDAICLAEARKAMKLLPIIPQGNYACVWLIIHHVFSASATILSHVSSNPSHSLVNEDLKLVQCAVQLLSDLQKIGTNLDVVRMKESLEDLWEKAVMVVGSVERTQMNTHGHMAPGGNNAARQNIRSLGEFITRIESLSAAKCMDFESQSPDHKVGLA